jgi:hypothetical protein
MKRPQKFPAFPGAVGTWREGKSAASIDVCETSLIVLGRGRRRFYVQILRGPQYMQSIHSRSRTEGLAVSWRFRERRQPNAGVA